MEMWMTQMIYGREHRNFLLLMYVICTLSKRIISHDIWWSFTTYIQSNKYSKRQEIKSQSFIIFKLKYLWWSGIYYQKQ